MYFVAALSTLSDDGLAAMVREIADEQRKREDVKACAILQARLRHADFLVLTSDELPRTLAPHLEFVTFKVSVFLAAGGAVHDCECILDNLSFITDYDREKLPFFLEGLYLPDVERLRGFKREAKWDVEYGDVYIRSRGTAELSLVFCPFDFGQDAANQNRDSPAGFLAFDNTGSYFCLSFAAAHKAWETQDVCVVTRRPFITFFIPLRWSRKILARPGVSSRVAE